MTTPTTPAMATAAAYPAISHNRFFSSLPRRRRH